MSVLTVIVATKLSSAAVGKLICIMIMLSPMPVAGTCASIITVPSTLPIGLVRCTVKFEGYGIQID